MGSRSRAGAQWRGVVDNRSYQIQDDYSRIWGRHQVSVGANLAYATLDSFDYANAAGNFAINGSVTGIGAGRLHGRPGVHVDARDAEHPAQPSVVHRDVRAGYVEGVGSPDAQSGYPVGAVLRDLVGERRDLQFLPRQLQQGHQERAVPERAGRPPLPW